VIQSITMFSNISNRFNIPLLAALVFLLNLSSSLKAQDSSSTRPTVIKNLQDYYEQVKDDSTKQMVELKKMIPGLRYDLRYATNNNFMHRLMYPEKTTVTFLRLPAAIALQKIQYELREKGMGLKIFDAYRPYSVTVKFWELVKDERYVANPAKGSGHNRGIAVDLTIIDLKTEKELDMGTGFDNFTDSAHQSFQLLPEKVLANRKLLRSVMEKYGFKVLETEWWHYFLGDGAKFEVLDISFRNLTIEH
jgi:D-alanyl-D-alanine dipeptidase